MKETIRAWKTPILLVLALLILLPLHFWYPEYNIPVIAGALTAVWHVAGRFTKSKIKEVEN